MKSYSATLTATIVLGALISAAVTAFAVLSEPDAPWELREGGWRTDPTWYDGQAEICVYEATRTIYGVERRYLARAYTNVQHMDEATAVKAAGDGGLEVFKHHWSERVETERYDYDFSTASFLERATLEPFKLTAATQEDCGASFKQLWRDGRQLSWLSSVYFPGAGLKQGGLPRPGVHLADSLSLVLRDYPFEDQRYDAAANTLPLYIWLDLVPSQKDTHEVAFEPVRHRVWRSGTETLDLPIGPIEAYPVRVQPEGAQEPSATYWFAAEGGAPWLHCMVAYEGPGGVSYRLRSLERSAYWERP